MKLETRVFELSHGKYASLTELAKAMGISVSQVFRVREGTRTVNRKFIIGAKRAFPEHKLDDLFYFVPDGGENAEIGHRLSRSQGKPSRQKPNLKAMLTPRQVADLLGVHLTTVRRWSNQGMLKAYRIGSRGDRRFRQEEVDVFLKKCE